MTTKVRASLSPPAEKPVQKMKSSPTRIDGTVMFFYEAHLAK